jgi:hypothetical protein
VRGKLPSDRVMRPIAEMDVWESLLKIGKLSGVLLG